MSRACCASPTRACAPPSWPGATGWWRGTGRSPASLPPAAGPVYPAGSFVRPHFPMDILFGLFGLAVLIGIAWLFSINKRAVDWKLVATGVGLQVAFASLVLLVPGGKDVFQFLSDIFVK